MHQSVARARNYGKFTANIVNASITDHRMTSLVVDLVNYNQQSIPKTVRKEIEL